MRRWASKRNAGLEAQTGETDSRYTSLVNRPGISREAVDRALAGFRGDLVFPGDADYDAARRLSNLRFDFRPALIAYCVCDSDVRVCLSLSRSTGIPFRVRAGGHSSGGYSESDSVIVIDVSRLDNVSVDPRAKTVTAGSGTLFSKLNAELEHHQSHIPGAECQDVAVGGHVQGGGYGSTSPHLRDELRQRRRSPCYAGERHDREGYGKVRTTICGGRCVPARATISACRAR